MREKIGEFKGKQKSYYFFDSKNGYQIICTGPLTLKVRGVLSNPSLEEVILSLFVNSQRPLLHLNNGLLIYGYTDFDYFIYKNFPKLNPSKVRKTLRRMGWIVSPPSRTNGTSPFPADYLERHTNLKINTSSIAVIKVKEDIKAMVSNMENQLYEFDFHGFSYDALVSMVEILSGEPLTAERRENIAAQSYVLRGPFVNDGSAIFIQFSDNKAINIEPDYVTLIVPKTNHITVRSEYTKLFMDLLKGSSPSTVVYGNFFEGTFYGISSKGELVCEDEESILNKPEIKIIEAQKISDEMADQIRKIFGVPELSREFAPALYEFFIHGGTKDDLCIHSLQTLSTNIWR